MQAKTHSARAAPLLLLLLHLAAIIQLPETINSYREAFPGRTFSSLNVISLYVIVSRAIDKTAEKSENEEYRNGF